MAKLVFDHTHEEEELPDNSPLETCCENHGLPFACSEGICGTCIFEVIEGGENLSDPTEAEVDFLGEQGVKKERMACQCKIKNGTVKIKF